MSDFLFDFCWPHHRICQSPFLKYLTFNFDDLELGKFKIVQGQRSWCQSEAHWRFPMTSIVSNIVSLTTFEIFNVQYLWHCTNTQCSRKRVQQLKKRKKSRFLDFQKNVKNVKKRTYNFSWLINFYCSSIFTAVRVWHRSHSMFSSGSEWITLADLGTQIQWSLSEVCEFISMDWGLNFC